MKKLILTLTLAALLLCGCSAESSNVTAVTENIQFTAQIDYSGTNYIYSVKIPESSHIIMETVCPESIKGTVFDFNGTDVTTDYNGLKITENISDTALSPASFIYSVFSDADSKKDKVRFENNEFYITAKKPPYNYRLYLGCTGLPIKITDDSGLTAIIKDATIG